MSTARGRSRGWDLLPARAGRRRRGRCCARRPAICPPVLTRDHAAYGGLDGRVHVVPLKGGKSVVVGDGIWRADQRAAGGGGRPRVYAGSEDGYLYVYGPNGNAASADEGPGGLESSQSADGPDGGQEVRLVHELRRQRRLERERPGAWSLRCACAGRGDSRARSSICPSAGAAGFTRTPPKARSSRSSRTPAASLWRRYWPDVYLVLHLAALRG